MITMLKQGKDYITDKHGIYTTGSSVTNRGTI